MMSNSIRQSKNREIRTALVELGLSDDLLVEGKAICFGETILLFTFGDTDYFERIEPQALNGADLSAVYFYYNHNDFAYASTKNNTLELDIREDGVYFKAHLPDTSSGRDLYTLIKRGDIDKCSFGFTVDDEEFDEKTNTFIIKKIKKLYEISVVDFPAYENTSISARSEVEKIEEKRQTDINNQKKKLILKTLY